MRIRPILLIVAAAIAFAAPSLAQAPAASSAAVAATPANIRPFVEADFAKAKADGKPILIEVAAPWCPTCRAQKPIIQSLAGKRDYAGLQVFQVDFDTQTDARRALRAQSQSTLIVFKGGKETGRSVGVTDPAAIEALVRTAF